MEKGREQTKKVWRWIVIFKAEIIICCVLYALLGWVEPAVRAYYRPGFVSGVALLFVALGLPGFAYVWYSVRRGRQTKEASDDPQLF